MANRIKQLLKEKDWTFEDLAAETGFRSVFLSLMQNAKCGTSLEHVIPLAEPSPLPSAYLMVAVITFDIARADDGMVSYSHRPTFLHKCLLL